MELNILESGKIEGQSMVMGLCNQIRQSTLDSLWTVSNIFMEDKYKNIKFIKVSLIVDVEKDRESNIRNSLWNRESLMNIWLMDRSIIQMATDIMEL